jgi:hypothetical protein
MKQIFASGLAAGVAMLAASVILMMAFSAIFPELTAQYSSSAIFRPWSDPWMYYIYINPILVGLILAFIWPNVKGLFNAKSPCKKGAKFGVASWALFGITGMLMTISTFNISTLMVLTWTISALVQDIVGGIVIAKLSK